MKKTLLIISSLSLFGSLFSQTWTTVSAYGGGLAYSVASFVIDDIAYVGGGNTGLKSFHKYDPVQDTWTKLSDIGGGFNRASPIAFSINGKGYIGGGSDMGAGTTNSFYEYDPTSDTWTKKSDFPGGIVHSGFYASVGGKGYVICGTVAVSSSSEVWEYDPGNDTWTMKTPYPEGPTYWPTGFVLRDKIYMGTGSASSVASSSFYEYDPANDIWKKKADFPGLARSSARGFAVGVKGYLGGGVANGFTSTFNDFYEYDAVADSWIIMPTLSYPTGATAWVTSFVIGKDAYIGTGASLSSGVSPTDQFYKATFENNSVGLSEVASDGKSRVRVYPNPAENLLFIDYQGDLAAISLIITDIRGRQLKRLNGLTNSLDINSFSPGMYFFTFSDEMNYTETQRVEIR